MHILGHGVVFIYNSQLGSLIVNNIACFSRQFTYPNASSPGAKNTTRVQNDHHDVYLTCHIEILANNEGIVIVQFVF
jgi:hypothetical protein